MVKTATVCTGIGHTVIRNPNTPDEEYLDVWIEIEGRLISPAFSGDRWDPPHGAEWEFEVIDVTLDLPKHHIPGPEDVLSPGEKREAIVWFESPAGQYCAEEACNDTLNDSDWQ